MCPERSLELQPQVESRAAALEFPPAQTGAEAVEALRETAVEPVVDSKIDSTPGARARFLAFLSGERASARAGRHEPQAGPEPQGAPQRPDRHLQFRPDLELAERDRLAIRQIAKIAAFRNSSMTSRAWLMSVPSTRACASQRSLSNDAFRYSAPCPMTSASTSFDALP